MRTLILYATKHGATKEIAEKLAGQFEGATVCNLDDNITFDLGKYDCVMIGSALYAGMVRKSAKEFVKENADALKKVQLGLFLSGMQNDGEDSFLKMNYPEEITAHAKAVALLAGISDPSKGNFFEKLVMRIVTKKSVYVNTISDEKVAAFADAMKK